MYRVPFILLITVFLSCEDQNKNKNRSTNPPVAVIESLDESFHQIVHDTARVEIIADGCDWSEGPLWLDSYGTLLFSDVPANTIYKWSEQYGKQVYLKPSGYTETARRGGETGSNGLLLDSSDRLVLCQHGNRQLAIMDAPINDPKPNFKTLAANYQGKKFNSPNDAAMRTNGDIFFTDPPYGLEKNMEDPLKEMPFQGVYKVTPSGQVTLLLDSITRPNGIAVTRDDLSLIVANSDEKKKIWYMYDFGRNDSLINPIVFYDATSDTAKGAPDGLKIDRYGNVFATGPGGVWIFNREGLPLGRIKFPEFCSNVALSGDEKTLFITADMYVLRVKMR
ncbi:MAG TPA: SMP-30/gluconolactonase/LRE family protein [Flavitalea sp.]|nr:SMP-30/gluconolactonase/LRE family protein [Flavitalea sp.]